MQMANLKIFVSLELEKVLWFSSSFPHYFLFLQVKIWVSTLSIFIFSFITHRLHLRKKHQVCSVYYETFYYILYNIHEFQLEAGMENAVNKKMTLSLLSFFISFYSSIPASDEELKPNLDFGWCMDV